MALMHWKCVVEDGGSEGYGSNTEVPYETIMIMEWGGKFAVYLNCLLTAGSSVGRFTYEFHLTLVPGEELCVCIVEYIMCRFLWFSSISVGALRCSGLF
jgi:hypothetical protein